MPARLIGPCCSRAGCIRPARELGGLCTRCWMGCTPAERWSLQMEAEYELDQMQRTEPIDSLEVIFGLPSYERPEAA